jgi:hypothetical protein
MSATVEWYDTSWLSVEVVDAGTEIGEFSTNSTAVVIAGDSVAVVEGDTDRLIMLFQRALDDLKVRRGLEANAG